MRIPSAAIDQGNMIPISEAVDPVAAAMIEPFACVLRGQDTLRIQPGETVLVVGAGPIGILHVMLARLKGAGKIFVSEINPDRIGQALKFGADQTINPEEEDLADVVAAETERRGVDVVIVAAPAPQAQAQVLEVAAIGGRINFFGGLPKDRPTIQFDSNQVHYKELIVTGTTACSTHDCRRAAHIVSSGYMDLSKVVGARFPLSEVVEALVFAESGQSLKVVMEP
jgi:L-iditol 2-dehydrogenase